MRKKTGAEQQGTCRAAASELADWWQGCAKSRRAGRQAGSNRQQLAKASRQVAGRQQAGSRRVQGTTSEGAGLQGNATGTRGYGATNATGARGYRAGRRLG